MPSFTVPSEDTLPLLTLQATCCVFLQLELVLLLHRGPILLLQEVLCIMEVEAQVLPLAVLPFRSCETPRAVRWGEGHVLLEGKQALPLAVLPSRSCETLRAARLEGHVLCEGRFPAGVPFRSCETLRAARLEWHVLLPTRLPC